jgi:hypothetical protein
MHQLHAALRVRDAASNPRAIRCRDRWSPQSRPSADRARRQIASRPSTARSSAACRRRSRVHARGGSRDERGQPGGPAAVLLHQAHRPCAPWPSSNCWGLKRPLHQHVPPPPRSWPPGSSMSNHAEATAAARRSPRPRRARRPRARSGDDQRVAAQLVHDRESGRSPRYSSAAPCAAGARAPRRRARADRRRARFPSPPGQPRGR